VGCCCGKVVRTPGGAILPFPDCTLLTANLLFVQRQLMTHTATYNSDQSDVGVNNMSAYTGIDGLDAVVSTIGGTLDNPQADSEGNINVINAAMEAGVKKFVLVTSIGTGDSKVAPAQQVYDTLKPVLLEKEKAEEALQV